MPAAGSPFTACCVSVHCLPADFDNCCGWAGDSSALPDADNGAAGTRTICCRLLVYAWCSCAMLCAGIIGAVHAGTQYPVWCGSELSSLQAPCSAQVNAGAHAYCCRRRLAPTAPLKCALAGAVEACMPCPASGSAPADARLAGWPALYHPRSSSCPHRAMPWLPYRRVSHARSAGRRLWSSAALAANSARGCCARAAEVRSARRLWCRCCTAAMCLCCV